MLSSLILNIEKNSGAPALRSSHADEQQQEEEGDRHSQSQTHGWRDPPSLTVAESKPPAGKKGGEFGGWWRVSEVVGERRFALGELLLVAILRESVAGL